MKDAVARHHDLDVLEGASRPTQELEALGVLALLDGHVAHHRIGLHAAHLDVERVIDDQLRRHARVHATRVAPGLGHGIAQTREVDQGGRAQQVLQHDARREEREVGVAAPEHDLLQPGRGFRGDELADDVLGKDPRRVGHAIKGTGPQALDRAAHVDSALGQARKLEGGLVHQGFSGSRVRLVFALIAF